MIQKPAESWLSRPRPALRAGVAGIAAGAAGIASSELVAGIVPGAPSLPVSVGSVVIALQPPGAKDVMTSLFGTNDKTALNVAVVMVALAVAAAAGILGRSNFSSGARIFLAFGLVAFAAAALQPLGSPALAAVNAIVATSIAVGVLRILMAEAGFAAPVRLGLRGPDRAGASVAPPRSTPAPRMPEWNRRRFLLRSGQFLIGALAAGTLGHLLLEIRHPSGPPASAKIPAAAETAAPLAVDSLPAPGVTPIVVSNDSFYRIDTELLVPQVDASGWQLKVTGMVDHPLTFSYPQLLAMPLFEQYVTLACVSNPVGGDLVGNTLWTGAHLKQILAQAGLQAGATQIVGRSVDGFTVGFPTAWALDPSREPMVAVGMNRSPLSAEHGYPARLIVPGLYGYMSATKWLSEIQLTTREAFDAYWVALGWAKDGPILTESRIDHPADGSALAVGQVDIDGLAWAPDRGVDAVEVRIDDGPWQEALLSRAISRATWVQWWLRWQATPGTHTIQVRATDGTGTIQTATVSGPGPAGATGYDQVQVTVA